jgi:hypothetical protein
MICDPGLSLLRTNTMKSLLSMLMLAGLHVGCAPCALDSVAHTEQERRAVFSIVLGEGGGITGTWEGYTIAGNGAVAFWKGRGARENEREAGRLPADTMGVLWDAARMLAVHPATDSTGSLVRYLSVTTGDTTRTYTWKPRLGVGQLPSAYQKYYERCSAAIRTSMTKATTTTTSIR